MRGRLDRHIEHRLEGGELPVALDQRDGAQLGLRHLLVPLRRGRGHVDEHEFGDQRGFGGGDAQRGEPAERHPDDEPRVGRPLAQQRRSVSALSFGP